MSTLNEIYDDNDLRVVLGTEAIDFEQNSFWILVENIIIDYDFTFPLNTNKIEDYESTLVYFNVFKYGLKFKNCVFRKKTQIYSLERKNRKLLFENCIFENEVVVRNFDSTLTFSKSNFKSNLNFHNAVLKGKTRFRECIFEQNVDFRNTRFEGLVDFWRSNFNQKIIFYKTDFLDTIVLSAAEFNENVSIAS